jgi:ElaB/YqjD/DUF883 family membrane-anchored ribosome-binding protein
MVMPDDHENKDGSHGSIADRLPNSEDLCGEVESYIKSKPFRSVAIALLVGVLVGKILL